MNLLIVFYGLVVVFLSVAILVFYDFTAEDIKQYPLIACLVILFCTVLWPIGLPVAHYVDSHSEEIDKWIDDHIPK